MPLVYRSVLRDANGQLNARVGRLFTDWLASKGITLDEEQLSGRFGARSTSSSGDEVWAHSTRVRLQGPKKAPGAVVERYRLVERTSIGRLSTTITTHTPTAADDPLFDVDDTEALFSMSDAQGQADAWTWVDLEHEPPPGESVLRPGSPRIVRDLMAAGEAHDGGVPLTAETWSVTEHHIDELVRHIASRKRHIPVMVFAYDNTKAYDREELSALLARDLAGVAAVFALASPEANEELARRLPPEYGVWGGALRTYLPGALQPDDQPSAHRVLSRKSIEMMGRRAFPVVKGHVLQLSASRPAPPNSERLRSFLSDAGPKEPGRPQRTPAYEKALVSWLTLQIARVRVTLGFDRQDPPPRSLEAAQSQLEHELDRLLEASAVSYIKGHEQEAPLVDVAGRIAKLEEDQALLTELLSEAESEHHTASATAKQERDARQFSELELADSLGEIDRLTRRLQFFETRARERQDYHAFAEAPVSTPPESMSEVIERSRAELAHVVIGDTDAEAAALDVTPSADLYAMKTGVALQALDEYAARRAAGEFAGSFFQWCGDSAHSGRVLPKTNVAMTESETVANNAELRKRRVFPVPTTVHEDGHLYMPAHIKIVHRGGQAPRLHFYDDAGGSTGKVHVGYIGEHLPTANFAH